MKKILLTGATGYIGKRLLTVLLENNFHVVCCTREEIRFEYPDDSFLDQITVIEVDFLNPESLHKIPKDIDAAYYLLHSMSASKNYSSLELECARNFNTALKATNCEQVIYLSGMVNTADLSPHLQSRKDVEIELSKGSFNLTTLRAGIIIGSGSASYEIIRDLTEKLPLMVTPRWVSTKCQPIGIANVLDFLYRCLFLEETYNKNFDIAGPDVLTYKQMLLGYAKSRGLKRSIVILPVMTPKLSSYWLNIVTSTNYKLASALVSSMKIDVVARNNDINAITGVEPFSYETALKRTQSKIKANEIVSGWKDSFVSSLELKSLSQFVEVPKFGCFVDIKTRAYTDKEAVLDRIFSIGGDTGWYSVNFLWKFRGFLDQLVGGVGLRRGRTHPTELHTGDAVDFWRVIYANREEGKLLLFAEMKVPGEAWLEFRIKNNEFRQKAVFRPKGLWGRLYWYAVAPFHGIVFNGMASKIATG